MTDTKFSNSTPITFEVPSKPQPAPAAQPAPGPADSTSSIANAAAPPRRPLGPTFQSTLRSTPPPDLDRHQRKCSICRRQDRDEIEQAFLHWKPISALELDYRLTERAIHRHAHATGLYARRKRNLRFILENVLERHAEARITVDSLLRAIRAYVSITDSGEYPERPAHVVVSSGGLFQGTSPGPSPVPSTAKPARTIAISPSRRTNPRRKPAPKMKCKTKQKVGTINRAKNGSLARRSRRAKAANRQPQSIRNRPNSLKTKHRSHF
ncbi:MAG TPA: hypothetical protein VEU52_02315 [Candidatus Limnocylindrales bacterium]|nr:hypothetical protein [Candidatus Limnocylindrales bacterium]